jgi:hypothetical protein
MQKQAKRHDIQRMYIYIVYGVFDMYLESWRGSTWHMGGERVGVGGG